MEYFRVSIQIIQRREVTSLLHTSLTWYNIITFMWSMGMKLKSQFIDLVKRNYIEKNFVWKLHFSNPLQP